MPSPRKAPGRVGYSPGRQRGWAGSAGCHWGTAWGSPRVIFLGAFKAVIDKACLSAPYRNSFSHFIFFFSVLLEEKPGKMCIYFSCILSTALTRALPACRLLCMSRGVGWEVRGINPVVWGRMAFIFGLSSACLNKSSAVFAVKAWGWFGKRCAGRSAVPVGSARVWLKTALKWGNPNCLGSGVPPCCRSCSWRTQPWAPKGFVAKNSMSESVEGQVWGLMGLMLPGVHVRQQCCMGGAPKCFGVSSACVDTAVLVGRARCLCRGAGLLENPGENETHPLLPLPPRGAQGPGVLGVAPGVPP